MLGLLYRISIIPLGLPSSSWTIFVDILFFVLVIALVAWYFYYFKRKDLIGKFLGAMLVAGIGSLIILATLQTFIYKLIIWLMSPKIGTTQISNLNLIAICLGAYTALYIMNTINHNKERRD